MLKKLEVKSLIKAKANLNPYSPKLYKGYFHSDTVHDNLTAVYYLNENNGYTFLKNNKKVKSKENRIVIFDAQMKHAGTNTTNEKKRVVLNLNYF